MEDGFCECAGCKQELVARFANQVGEDLLCRGGFEEKMSSLFVLPNAAKTLGRRGGLKGGPARAAKMTPEERSACAKKAAKSGWRRVV